MADPAGIDEYKGETSGAVVCVEPLYLCFYAIDWDITSLDGIIYIQNGERDIKNDIISRQLQWSRTRIFAGFVQSLVKLSFVFTGHETDTSVLFRGLESNLLGKRHGFDNGYYEGE